jgi:hypothetical protein
MEILQIEYNGITKHVVLQVAMGHAVNKLLLFLKNVKMKYPLFLSDSNKRVFFPHIFEKKNAVVTNFVKVRPVEAELSHANGRTNGRTFGINEAFCANFRKRLNATGCNKHRRCAVKQFISVFDK